MKSIIILLTVTFMCSVCKGQSEKDSIKRDIDNRFYKLGYVKWFDSVKIDFWKDEVENVAVVHSKANYLLSDSVWINNDSTYIVFRYFKEQEPNDYEGGDNGINVFDIDSTGNMYMGLDTVKIYFDSVTIYGNEPPVYHRKKDTISVIIQYSNTEPQEVVGWHNGKKYETTEIDYSVKWKKVYSVRELHNINEDDKFPNMPSGGVYEQQSTFWQHLYYLDQNKKELGKNIIIWQTKEIGKPSLK